MPLPQPYRTLDEAPTPDSRLGIIHAHGLRSPRGEVAFTEMHHSYTPALERVCNWMVYGSTFPDPRQAAEDIVQVTWLKIAKSVTTIRPNDPFSAFLRTVAKRTAIDAIRAQRARRHSLPTDPFDIAQIGQVGSNLHVEPGSDGHLAQLDLIDGLKCVRPDRGRLLVFRLMGMHDPELAAFDNVPIGTAKGRMRAAYEEAREVFEYDSILMS